MDQSSCDDDPLLNNNASVGCKSDVPVVPTDVSASGQRQLQMQLDVVLEKLAAQSVDGCIETDVASSGPVSASDGLPVVCLSKDMEDVGRYAYVSLVAHSLYMLFEYHKWHQHFQSNTLKDLLETLQLSEQTEVTIMMITRGDATFHSSEPFVNTLRKEPIVIQHGPQIIIADLLTNGLKKGCYDARMRVALKFIIRCFAMPWNELDSLEENFIRLFVEEPHEPTEEELKEKTQRERKRMIKRVALIGLATVGGGTLIGLTGGLAAPFIAAGAGVIIGGAGAAALGSAAGIAIIGSLFGVAGAGLTGYKMNKRMGGLSEFHFEPLSTGRSLHVTIAITGWLTDTQQDFKTPWLGLDNAKEQYTLRYESKYLLELGRVFDYLVSIGITAAVQETLKHTVLSGLLAAVVWPAALVSAASIIDNPWSVCTQRSMLTGKQLADVLLSRQQGKRPVTLIGYSFGARVIYACVQEMAKRKNCEGIIEDVILLGSPISGTATDWHNFDRVVSGRIVNGYCKSDWLLKFMYRTASVQLSVAGLSPIDWQHRLMHNIDLSEIVSGHFDYVQKMPEILEMIGVRVKPYVPTGTVDSLKEWADLHRKQSTADTSTGLNSRTDSSAVLDEAFEAEILNDSDSTSTAVSSQ